MFNLSFLIQKWKMIVASIVTIILLMIFWPLASIQAGHVGVITTFGKVSNEALGEGLHLVNPLSRIIEIPIRIQKIDVKGDAASRDLQSVDAGIALNFHLSATLAPYFYQNVGIDYKNTIVVPTIEETLKAVTAQYTAEELISKRDAVRQKIKSALSERLRQRTNNGLIVDDFSIVNFNFSQVFNKAIESKQEAEQLALKAERDLQRIKIEAEQKIVSGQAEAASLKAQKEEITPELIKLREIEAQREAIQKWDGKLPQYMGGATPFINLGGK